MMSRLSEDVLTRLIASLSPLQFNRFTVAALKAEQVRQGGTLESSCTSLGGQYLVVSHYRHEVQMGGAASFAADFLVTHHAPNLVAYKSFLDVFHCDLREAATILPEGTLPSPYTSPYGSGGQGTYYVSNVDAHSEYDANPADFLAEQERICESLGIRVDLIDPRGIARTLAADEDLETIVRQALAPCDSFAVGISPSGISVFPYESHNIFVVGEPKPEILTFSVPATYAVLAVTEPLNELQDLIRTCPPEHTIELFLKQHLVNLLSPRIISVEAQVIIASSRRRPDFFLHLRDEMWEPLEIKLPKSFSLRLDPSGPPRLASYLKNAIKQCKEYLSELDRVDVRKQLWARHGIRYEEPHITLLIGRAAFPKSVITTVAKNYDPRIRLLSYEELMREASQNCAGLLRAISTVCW